MARLAVIVAQGGVSSAGRTSGFNAYKRIVHSALSEKDQQMMLSSLKQLCLSSSDSESHHPSDEQLLAQTLVRKINLFNTEHTSTHHKLNPTKGVSFKVKKSHLPSSIPSDWHISPIDDSHVDVTLNEHTPLLLKTTIPSNVSAAGQLPDGFTPEKLYSSRSHPRGLAMTIYGASDAIQSMGIDWEVIKKAVPADKISVYAGSSMSQLDQNGNGGLLQARLKGQRVSAKQLALGFAEMPADFINAYVLGNLGSTGTSMGACATFLYNLRQGIDDIRSGRSRVVVVGNSEAPLTPEIIDGYSTMGALATDKALRKLDNLGARDTPDYRMACRPFAENAGFVLGESAQFFILMDDELALETGASILGSVADVFVNADGYKKSISSPGAGNYITVAKAVALGNQLFGEEALQHSMFHAHGTGTPQNRVTESQILSQVAHTFNIRQWPISAIKSYMGHSLAVAAGDQLMATLGSWKHGIIPGIQSIQHTADDIYTQNLNILTQHATIDIARTSLSFLNSKGFGGNNATATLISPIATENMLIKKHGQKAVSQWKQRNETVSEKILQHEQQCCDGNTSPTYRFGENVITPEDVKITTEELTLQNQSISLNIQHDYDDYL